MVGGKNNCVRRIVISKNLFIFKCLLNNTVQKKRSGHFTKSECLWFCSQVNVHGCFFLVYEIPFFDEKHDRGTSETSRRVKVHGYGSTHR